MEKQNLWKRIKKSFQTDDIFADNEIKSNLIVANIMFASAGVLLLSFLLNVLGVFETGNSQVLISTVQGMFMLVVPAVICKIFKGRKRWIKYVNMILFMLTLSVVDAFLGYNVTIIMVMPVLLSSRYYSKSFTYQVAIITLLLFAMSESMSAYYGFGVFDLNYYELPAGSTVVVSEDYTLKQFIKEFIGIDSKYRASSYMRLGFLPKAMMFAIISISAARIAQNGRDMILAQHDIAVKNAKIHSELALATEIQTQILPSIFPAYPDRREFDVYASMTPAKEVGGDFYDFFMVGENKIAVVIGDVSGKGVPAALFMVIAKTLIKNYALAGYGPAEIFTKANANLCDGNSVGLFVTAWMGILDLTDGKMIFVNAGHNPPMIKTNGGEFEFLRSKPGFVLGGMPTLKYKENELKLSVGDRLFLYTDGVTEAMNVANKLYGEGRLKEFLNGDKDKDVTTILRDLKNDIENYAGEAPQSDDVTMLMIEYCGLGDKADVKEAVFTANKDAVKKAMDYVEGLLDGYKITGKNAMSITTAFEEIFVNTVNYAYGGMEGEVTVITKYDEEGKEFAIKIKDKGIAFNPLKKKDPDITLGVEERQVGGLGIFMVKKMMDSVEYVRNGDENVLTMVKKL